MELSTDEYKIYLETQLQTVREKSYKDLTVAEYCALVHATIAIVDKLRGLSRGEC